MSKKKCVTEYEKYGFVFVQHREFLNDFLGVRFAEICLI